MYKNCRFIWLHAFCSGGIYRTTPKELEDHFHPKTIKKSGDNEKKTAFPICLDRLCIFESEYQKSVRLCELIWIVDIHTHGNLRTDVDLVEQITEYNNNKKLGIKKSSEKEDIEFSHKFYRTLYTPIKSQKKYIDEIIEKKEIPILKNFMKLRNCLNSKKPNFVSKRTRFTYKIQLLHTNKKHRVWRRFYTPANVNLFDFYDRIVCPIIGFARGYHGFYYDIKPFGPMINAGVVFGYRDCATVDMITIPYLKKDLINCTEVLICDLLNKVGDEIQLTHDCGERWIHSIVLEKIEYDQKDFIDIIEGEGACPIEDGFFKVPKNPQKDEGEESNSIDLHWNEAVDILISKKPYLQYKSIKNAIPSRVNYLSKRFPFNNINEFKVKSCRLWLNWALRDVGASYRETQNKMRSRQDFGVISRKGGFVTKSFRDSVCKLKCITCGKNEAPKCCGACIIERYCSYECQKKDWKKHKKICRKLKPHVVQKFENVPFIRTEDIESEDFKKRQAEDLMFNALSRIRGAGGGDIMSKKSAESWRKELLGMNEIWKRRYNENFPFKKLEKELIPNYDKLSSSEKKGGISRMFDYVKREDDMKKLKKKKKRNISKKERAKRRSEAVKMMKNAKKTAMDVCRSSGFDFKRFKRDQVIRFGILYTKQMYSYHKKWKIKYEEDFPFDSVLEKGDYLKELLGKCKPKSISYEKFFEDYLDEFDQGKEKK